MIGLSKPACARHRIEVLTDPLGIVQRAGAELSIGNVLQGDG